MLLSRVPLFDSTNTSRVRSTSKSLYSRLSSSRKASPTCTISLANANANNLCINVSSTPPSLPESSLTSIIPFPSSSEGPSISKSDSTCLALLRSSADTPRNRASPVQSAHDRRKRSTARLVEPTCGTKGSEAEVLLQVSSQPPRKRPRLNKGTKSSGRVSHPSTPEVRFMAMVQRSVARGVVERQVRSRSTSDVRSEKAVTLQEQDKLLARSLRSKLLAQGYRDIDLVDLDTDALSGVDVAMDVDVESKASVLASVDMDIDVEATPNCSSVPSSPVRPGPCPNTIHILSPPKLVAALIMRRNTQAPARFCPSERKRVPSPLATSQSFSESGDVNSSMV